MYFSLLMTLSQSIFLNLNFSLSLSLSLSACSMDNLDLDMYQPAFSNTGGHLPMSHPNYGQAQQFDSYGGSHMNMPTFRSIYMYISITIYTV